MIRCSKSKSEGGSPSWDFKTRFRITKAENLVNQERTIPSRTRRLKQNILRQNAFTYPIITSEIPAEHRIKRHDDKFAIIDDGHHRRMACEQLTLDVPEFLLKPEELTVKSWSRWFREVQPSSFESIKRKFKLTTDCGGGNGQTVIIYKRARYVFNPNAPIYQTIVKRILRNEESRGVLISEYARNHFAEYQLSYLFGKSLGLNQGVFVEDEASNDFQLSESDVFVVPPTLEYKEIIEITYTAGFPLVPKATRMVLGKTGRPIMLPIPLRFLSDSNLTQEEKTQALQDALADIRFEELSDVERRELAKTDRTYPEKLYAPQWTNVMKDEWLRRHFREYIE